MVLCINWLLLLFLSNFWLPHINMRYFQKFILETWEITIPSFGYSSKNIMCLEYEKLWTKISVLYLQKCGVFRSPNLLVEIGHNISGISTTVIICYPLLRLYIHSAMLPDIYTRKLKDLAQVIKKKKTIPKWQNLKCIPHWEVNLSPGFFFSGKSKVEWPCSKNYKSPSQKQICKDLNIFTWLA